MDDLESKDVPIRTWVIISLLVSFVLIKGIYALIVVNDQGQPGWDYRPVKDIPGESPYAIYQKLPHPQHVDGTEGE
ncbi:MAG: hypothetical protein V3S89_12790 [Desulfobacterales bacterium]